MPSVVSEIIAWSKTLPYWEQATLDKIISGDPLVQDDYTQILEFLLEDAGLNAKVTKRPKLAHIDSMATAPETQQDPIALTKICNLQNINALVPNQTLTFGPALTAVFGENGSGKSGYARVLGCAGFTRGDTQILPDVTKPVNGDLVLAADIEISSGGSTETIHFKVGDTCPKMSQCYVFDSTSVQIHLTGSNTFSFTPAGLSLLTRLSDVTDEIRNVLQLHVESRRRSNPFSPMFPEESPIKDFVKSLSTKTDPRGLLGLATLSQEQEQKMVELDQQIASLKIRDVPKQIERLAQTIRDLEQLSERLIETGNKVSDKAVADLSEAVQQFQRTEALAQALSADQFKAAYFGQVGTEGWRRFIASAKALADAERPGGKTYPIEGDRCLLCRQVLDANARKLMLDLWDYLKGSSQIQLARSSQVLSAARSSLVAADLKFFHDQLVSFRHLKDHDEAMLNDVTSFLKACQDRQNKALALADAHQTAPLTHLPPNPASRVAAIAEKLRQEETELKNENVEEKIIKFGQELTALKHRKLLHDQVDNIQRYLDDLKWADKAGKTGGDTRHITKKYKELFERLVTDKYLELFATILTRHSRNQTGIVGQSPW